MYRVVATEQQTQGNVLDAIVYLHQHFRELLLTQQTVQTMRVHMLVVGFPRAHVYAALHWFLNLKKMAHQPVPITETGVHHYSLEENFKLTDKARRFLYRLESLGILTVSMRELIIDRVMALEIGPRRLGLTAIQWVTFLVLSQFPAMQSQLFYLEDLIFHGQTVLKH